MLKPAPCRIHDCFDEDLDNSFEVFKGNCSLGYVRFSKTSSERVIWVDFLLAHKRGCGQGREMLDVLFQEYGFQEIKGSSIFEPHFFWKKNGAVFEYEVTEEDYDGVFFSLSRESFYRNARL